MAAAENIFDYIIVGGGIAGCTLASLLSKSKSSPSVLLIEAGPDVSGHPITQAPLACFAAHGSDIDWNYKTVPQRHLNDRPLYEAGGKALGGGSATNYATWTRGPKFDYDRWGKLVGDARWSYDGLLPYFEKTEKDYISTGTVSKSSPNRKYPLRDQVLKAWLNLGLDKIENANSGDPLGVGELVENWKDGKRQLASVAFDLGDVKILTETVVQKVLLEKRQGKLTTTGVQLHDGRQLLASKEVILSAGAFRTPQLLMLSGIGPAIELNKANIPTQLDLPGVGQNFHDHLLIGFAFRLKDPSLGLAMGGAAGPWADPAYQMGLAADWVVTENVPRSFLEEAVKEDIANDPSRGEDDYAVSLLDHRAAHLETIVVYVPSGPPITNLHVPFDGSHVGAVVGVMSPTSRGRIGLSSASALDPPAIDPNYNATSVDRALFRYGVRRVLKAVHDSMSDVIESENPPPSLEALTDRSSDSAIDARVRSEARTFFHAAGSASMGSVVDTELRVKGVDGLRVVDASVIPVPIGGHLQVATYAIAEQAADLITQEN
ncbi:uncharacterized protein Z520_02595 [Fonsecaea multimorphosa CBS 102226]|uniref:Glucose-methanol-choline oxidoreductase N-terminal domain-containing protein n=1 Tax=Fonsecaea multimorphosa CBS 102226 TaxID=1442371 RepID=A0A0D2HKS0_9EURO|nr:uncharacterized protein Z520_02595 [Fonsecaea multimorphosa CBS 102226]KIY02456.1 hypothetical protein Z520_02595 [Fonsecaea multimorphosa CBS 102226]OAL29096.1 hypothetical protein AYO22_02533 [Fonsecaea multimorphosa]